MIKKTYSAFGATQRVAELMRGDWRDVCVIVVYAIGVGLCSLVFPIAVKSLVNTVFLLVLWEGFLYSLVQ